MGIVSWVFLFLAGLFLVLWFVTPPDSVYETVEMEIVRTRKVLLTLAVVFLGFWLAVEFYFSKMPG